VVHLEVSANGRGVARQQASAAAHLLESDTGHAPSVTLWEDDDALVAADRVMGKRSSPPAEASTTRTRRRST
jgi:hypothetical protein